jgi:hypothetical protein
MEDGGLAPDYSIVDKLCSVYAVEEYRANSNGMHGIFGDMVELQWYFSDNGWKVYTYHFSLGNFSDVRRELEFRQKWTLGEIVSRERNVQCTKSYPRSE